MSRATRMGFKTVSPFDFGLSCEIFSAGDKQIQKYEKKRFWQIIRVNGKLVLATVRSLGTVEKPKLVADLKAEVKLSNDDFKLAKETIKNIFNLDFDLTSFYEESETDDVMRYITRRLWGLKSPSTATVFEALIDSVIEQQISIKVANHIENKLIRNFGDALTLEDETYYAYPTSQKLASLDIGQIRKCGLSNRKAEYIKGISELVVNGELDLEALKNCSNREKIINELDRVRGVGLWTVELTMLRGMQKLDAFPADDLGLRRVISRYYFAGQAISSFQARKTAEKWGTWKGLAAYYLIIAEMKNIET